MTTTTAKLDPRIKEVWMAGLLSGEYEQGIAGLHRDDTFCCLGVLCDVLGAEWEPFGLGFSPVFDGVAGDAGVLPRFVQKAAGLSPSGFIDVLNDSLAGLNDGGKTFAEIAAVIDEYL